MGTLYRGGRNSLKETLESLKKNGCSVLLAGDLPIDIVNEQSEKFLGADSKDLPPRYRIFGLLGRPESVASDRLGTPVHAAKRGTVVNGPPTGRASAAATPSGAGTALDRTPGLEQFVDEIGATISDIQQNVQSLDAAQLRVCIDSLNTLDDTDARRQVITGVNKHAYDVDGMVHYVLDAPYDSEAAQDLHDDVDVILEYDTSSGSLRQRHRVPAEGIVSAWWML